MTAFEYARLIERRRAAGIGEDGKALPESRKRESREVEQEKVLQSDTEDWLDERSIYWHHDLDRRKDIPGVPDLLICHNGRFVAVELKSRTGKLSPEQAGELAKIRRSGGSTFVCRSMEEFIAVMDRELVESNNES
jgi:hypothetical protein